MISIKRGTAALLLAAFMAAAGAFAGMSAPGSVNDAHAAVVADAKAKEAKAGG